MGLPSNKHWHRQVKKPPDFPDAVRDIDQAQPGMYKRFYCKLEDNGRFKHCSDIIEILEQPPPGDKHVLVRWGSKKIKIGLEKLGLAPDFTGKWDHYNHIEPFDG